MKADSISNLLNENDDVIGKGNMSTKEDKQIKLRMLVLKKCWVHVFIPNACFRIQQSGQRHFPKCYNPKLAFALIPLPKGVSRVPDRGTWCYPFGII